MKPILITLALAACSLIAQAQPEGGGPPPGGPEGGPPPGGPRGMRRAPDPLMVALDADKNGELSAAEIANATVALKALDKDADGKITKEELRPARPPRGEGPDKGQPDGPPPGGPEGARRPAPPLAAALDADKNEEISADEIANAAAALATLDKNADGAISQAEVRPARGEGAKGPGKGPGNGPGQGKPNRGGRPGADGPPPGR